MMQYAQWQSQPSWTLMNPRVRSEAARLDAEREPGRRARGRRIAPRPAAIAPATSSAVPTNALTRSSIASNCAPFKFTAQPATRTRSAVFSERRTAWRDFASASLVMQHVLITCSSASSSAASVWPAASSARRAIIASACETLQPRNLTANDATVAAR